MRDRGSRTGQSSTRAEKVPAKVLGVMALTTALTFATLTTGYQLLFPPHQMIA